MPSLRLVESKKRSAFSTRPIGKPMALGMTFWFEVREMKASPNTASSSITGSTNALFRDFNTSVVPQPGWAKASESVSDQPPPLWEGVTVPSRGWLEIRTDERKIVFERTSHDSLHFKNHSIFNDPGSLTYAAAADGRSVLLGRHASHRLHFFNVGLLQFETVQGFERLPRAESTVLHAIGAEYLAITENGLTLIGSAGQILWRSIEVTMGWQFLVALDETLWLKDGHGNILGLDRASGKESSP